MGKTKIEWTDYTFNPWWGCVGVSEGCKHCYAERCATRFGFDVWGPEKARRFFDDRYWAIPEEWNATAEKLGVRWRVFCGSMCDVFEAQNDILNGQRQRLWNLIERTPALDWLLLTKRPENIEGMLPEVWSSWGYWRVFEEYKSSPFPCNVWLGVTAENQARFDERWPVLENVGRRWYVPMLFVSVEPMLGPLKVADCLTEFIEHEEDNTVEVRGVDWVICGGESGPKARGCSAAWVRDLRAQCAEAEAPFFFKGWGSLLPMSQMIPGVHCADDALPPKVDSAFVRVKQGECLLDGREWKELPDIWSTKDTK